MAVPTGTASLLDIQNEFGGSAPISLSEYYGAASGVPTSGTISIDNFRGKSNTVNVTFLLIGGGGGAGSSNSGRPGGGGGAGGVLHGTIAVAPGTYSFTIGAGGSGGGGSNGGDSTLTIGSVLTAYGGGLGHYSSDGWFGAPGGNGGSGGGGGQTSFGGYGGGSSIQTSQGGLTGYGYGGGSGVAYSGLGGHGAGGGAGGAGPSATPGSAVPGGASATFSGYNVAGGGGTFGGNSSTNYGDGGRSAYVESGTNGRLIIIGTNTVNKAASGSFTVNSNGSIS